MQQFELFYMHPIYNREKYFKGHVMSLLIKLFKDIKNIPIYICSKNPKLRNYFFIYYCL